MKYIGIILIIISAIMMMVSYSMGWSDYNWVMGGLMTLMVISLVLHIVLNRIYQ